MENMEVIANIEKAEGAKMMERYAVPDGFKLVSYVSSRIPGVDDQENLSLGANCQVYIYAILKYFGFRLPNLRSSELWDDKEMSHEVSELKKLDIMFYNDTNEAYGAHVGLYWGEGMVLHLSKENGTPKVEAHQHLLSLDRYKSFVGAKRVNAL